MERIIIVANQKGGVGKTTTTMNLGAALSERKNRVLLIDLDPQSSLTIALKIDLEHLQYSIYDALLEKASLEKVHMRLKDQDFDILPSNIHLANAESELLFVMEREFRLKSLLAPVKHDYDYILIDCPPSLGVLTTNALTASDHILVPVQTDYMAMQGAKLLFATVSKIQERLNPDVTVSVVLTMMYQKTKHSTEVESVVRDQLQNSVHKVIIPGSVRVKEAPIVGESILTYDTKSPVSSAYRELAKEIAP